MPETYRFWGRQDPRGREKPPIRAFVPAPAADDQGVATLRLYDPIDSWGGDWGVSAKEFADALAAIPDATEIRLHINSPGGEVYDAIAILNALRSHPARIVAVVEGIAASAASFIATGADELQMSPNTELMIHDAWGIAIGPAETMHETGDKLDRISNNIASIYAAKAGGTVESWRAAMLAETWYSADEAVAAGLADSVASPQAAQDAPASDRWRAVLTEDRSPEKTEDAPAAEGLDRLRFAARKAGHARHRHELIAARHGLSVRP